MVLQHAKRIVAAWVCNRRPALGENHSTVLISRTTAIAKCWKRGITTAVRKRATRREPRCGYIPGTADRETKRPTYLPQSAIASRRNTAGQHEPPFPASSDSI